MRKAYIYKITGTIRGISSNTFHLKVNHNIPLNKKFICQDS